MINNNSNHANTQLRSRPLKWILMAVALFALTDFRQAATCLPVGFITASAQVTSSSSLSRHKSDDPDRQSTDETAQKKQERLPEKRSPEETASAKRSVDESGTDKQRADVAPVVKPDLVIQFARQHHPELADLIQQLRLAGSSEFDRAIKQLATEMHRLERIKERTPQRFEMELEGWKLESKTRLLVARWAMSKDPEQEKQIRDLLRQRRQIRVNQLQQEKQRLEERMSVLKDQLASATEKLDQQVEEEWQRLARRAGSTPRPSPPNAAKSSNNPDKTSKRLTSEKPETQKPER